MLKLLIFTTILFLSGCTFKNTPHINALEAEAKAHESHVGTIYKNIVYKSTLMHTLHLDLYMPLVKRYKHAPIYIYIHGGSWLRGDKELVNVYYKTVEGLRNKGIAVVSIDYRFVSQSGIEAMVEDCRDALVFVQEHADMYGLDAHRIGLHGHSAGANLALLTGFKHSELTDDILFIVDEYGPTDAVKLLQERKDRVWWTYFISDNDLNQLSPIQKIHPLIPPVYIAHGDADTMVPLVQSKHLYKALQANTIESRLVILKGAEHGYKGLSDIQIQEHRQEVLAYMLAKFKASEQ